MLKREELLLGAHYLHNYTNQIGKISILAIVCAFFEAVNLGALVPLLQTLNSPTAPGGTVWDILRDTFGFIGLELNFLNLLLIMGIVFIVGQILLYIKKRMQANLWFTFSADLKMSLFEKLMRTDIRYHYSKKSGTFIDLLNRQAEYAATTVFVVTEIFTYVIFIIFYIAILLYISLQLTIICLIIALSSMYFLNFLIRRSKKIGIKSRDTNMYMNEFITERLNLLKLIKIFSTEDIEIEKFKRVSEDYTKNTTEFLMNGIKIETSFQIIIFGIALIMLYISAILFNMPLAMLLVFIFTLIRLTDPVRQINAKRHELGGELASLEKIDETLRESTAHATIKSGTMKFETVNDTIALNHICFSYTSTVPVIKDVSFCIRKNEMIALVGASGGGKSTIVDLIIRLIEPDSGTISIDNKDIRTFNMEDYHRKIGFVSQESYIFNDSILNNICYGTGTTSMDRVMEAAKTANAHDFIMRLPNGYHTELGERGVKISGGEKQRISLARAIYKNPEILILDEATSALDSEAEKIIQQSILSIKNKYTIVAIAHRISTIENADKILVVENGQIVEGGTHKELITANGIYAKYYNIQYRSIHPFEQINRNN